MNISDIDCPQFVCFKNLQDDSAMSTDSLEPADQSENYDPEDSVPGDVSSVPSMSSCQEQDSTLHETSHSIYSEVSSANDMIEGDLSECSDLKENFPVHFSKGLSAKPNPALAKTTVPKPFTFQTDNRLKSKEKESGDYEKKDFASELRQNIVSQPARHRVTKVKPFNLTESKKRKFEGDYQSMAEQVIAFQKKTPERYHSSSQKGFQPQQHCQPTRVVPKSPKLQAIKRRRMVAVLSREQEEEKEIADMKVHEFHAKPLDPKVFNQPFQIKKQSKVGTTTKDFHLKTAQRSNATQRRKKSEKKYKFKARPVPKAILSGTTGLKEKEVIPVTEAKAPEFEVDHRLEKRKEHEIEKEKKAQQEQELIQTKAAAKPKHPAPTSAPYTKKKTVMKPFSFDQKDKERLSQKEKKIQEELENESKPYVFHAQLLPFPEPDALPAVPKKPPTEPVPFKFLLDDRVSNSSHTVLEESVSFKALPATVLKKEPFVPEKAPKHTIEIQEFNLHTDQRVLTRQHLKELKDKEEQEREQILLAQKAMEEELERSELLEMRKKLVHKANPIRQFKPVEIKSSSIPLTEPRSPDFETDKRLQSRH